MLEPVIGINVNKKPFPVEQGYEIYEEKRFRLLLVHLESLKDYFASAVKMFLGVSDLPLLPGNIGPEKRYADIYERL